MATKLFRRIRRFATALAVAIALPVTAAMAFVITPDGDRGLRVTTPSALYVGSDGVLKKVLDTGIGVPGGGEIADLGNPAIAPDGKVIFGALVANAGKVEWRLFRVEPSAIPEIRLEEVLKGVTLVCQHRPVFRSDPRVEISGDGSLAFATSDEFGTATLFRLTHGRLDCALRAGEKTAEGHLIINLNYGLMQVSQDGSAVLSATLATDLHTGRDRKRRNAILLATPGQAVREVVVEGETATGNQPSLADLGAPAIASSNAQPWVAFTGRTASGRALLLGRPGQMVRAISTGAATTEGPLTWLSNERPSIAPDGSVAIEAASGAHSMILGVRAGEPFVIASEGDRVDSTHVLSGVADPVHITSARVLVEAADQTGRVGIYSFATSANGDSHPSTVLNGEIELFPSSLAVSGSGRYAFLSMSPSETSRGVKDSHTNDHRPIEAF